MIDPLTLLAFVPATLALNITPGADMMFCMGQGLKSGRRAAIAASAGVSMGGMIHVTLAGLGLGALVAQHPVVFDVIRWVGVAYLLYLAWGAVRGGSAVAKTADVPRASTRRAFLSGFYVNLTNPKVILFVLAFLPQFVDPAAGSVLLQFLCLGLIIAICGFVVNAFVGAGAGQLGQSFASDGGVPRALSWITGGIFAGLALRLAVLEKV